MQFPKHGKRELPQYGKSMGKNKHSKIMKFLNISCEAETHTISKPRNERISILRYQYGKTQAIPRCRSTLHIKVNGNPSNPQCLGMCKFPYHRGIQWKAISCPGCRFLRKLEFIRKPKQSQSMSQVKYHTMGIPKEKLLYSHNMGFD